MAVFEEVRLPWDGREYVIAPDRVLRCISNIESLVDVPALLARAQMSHTLPIATLSRAWGMVLRYAGANVSDEEVYVALFAGEDERSRAIDVLSALVMMMVPPEHLRDGKAGKRKATGGASAEPPAASSPSTTSSSSGKAG